MTSVTSQILAHAKSLPEGGTISARDLLHLGSRQAIDQGLSRLTRKGKLFRIATGLYVRPVHTRWGITYPHFDLVIRNLVKVTGEIVAPTGGVSANRLDLTTQNPMQTILLTSGSNRKLRFNKLVVELRNAPKWQLLGPNSIPGHVVRAIDFMGKHHADWVIEKLAEKISLEDRKTLLSFRRMVPSWISDTLTQLEQLCELRASNRQ